MDLQKFSNADFTQREQAIDVPELAEFFAEGEAPVWVVRGLTGAELGRCNQAADNRQEITRALIAAMAGDGDKAAALRNAMGISEDEVPQDVSRRIELITVGSVSPMLGQDNRDVAVKLAEAFPVTFFNLSNAILGLTGQGAELGKPKHCGATPG